MTHNEFFFKETKQKEFESKRISLQKDQKMGNRQNTGKQAKGMNQQTIFLDQGNQLDPYYNTKLFEKHSLTIEFLFQIIIILLKIPPNLHVTSTPILLKTKYKKHCQMGGSYMSCAKLWIWCMQDSSALVVVFSWVQSRAVVRVVAQIQVVRD